MGFKDLPREVKELIRSFNSRPVVLLKYKVCREIESLSSKYIETYGEEYWDRRCFSEIHDFIYEYGFFNSEFGHIYDKLFEGLNEKYTAHIKSKTRP